MKLPWIRLPTLSGLGTETPTPKPSMISPRRELCEVSRTNPVAPPVWLPSTITRMAALFPSVAGMVFGSEVIRVGSPVCDRRDIDRRGDAAGQRVRRDEGRNGQAGELADEADGDRVVGQRRSAGDEDVADPEDVIRAARTWAVLALKGMGSVVTTGKGAWVVRVNEPPVGAPVRVRT